MSESDSRDDPFKTQPNADAILPELPSHPVRQQLEPSPGLVLADDYLIERFIGRGGMGIVYQARQLSSGDMVAIKLLGPTIDDDEGRRRFAREARASGMLQHTNIVRQRFVGEDRGLCFMVLDFVAGVSLRELIKRLRSRPNYESLNDVLRIEPTGSLEPQVVRLDTDERLPQPSTVSYLHTPSPPPLEQTSCYHHWCCGVIAKVADALEYAHSQGLIHRDVKPGNILVDESGVPYLIDFGLARSYDDSTLTASGHIVGTPAYMSPEQIEEQRDVDARTDVYSLALTLYELLTLEQPFVSTGGPQRLHKILYGALPPVSWLNPSVPRQLESVIHKATSKHKQNRHASAKELSSDLRRMVSGETVSARKYSYQFDPSGITTTRPGGIATMSFLVWAVSIGMLANSIFLAWDFINLEESRHLMTLAGVALYGMPGLIGAFTGWGLLLAQRWTWWLVLAASSAILMLGALLLLLSIVVPEQVSPNRIAISGLIFLSGTALAGFYVLLGRRTRNWFRTASAQRRDFSSQRKKRPSSRTKALP